MKCFVDLTFIYFSTSLVLKFVSVVSSSQSFLFEKMHNFGLGQRIIPNYRRFVNFKEHPEPLPTTRQSPLAFRPIKNLYQGMRKPNDTRVYRRSFEYEAKQSGHHVFCEGKFDCVITHLAIETTNGIPILFRGGVGHRYFVVIAKAKPGDELKGTVRAYCLKKHNEYYMEYGTTTPSSSRSFRYQK